MKAETFLPEDYHPAEDEPFMNDMQLEYFRRKLTHWKQELLDGAKKRTARWNCAHATVSANW